MAINSTADVLHSIFSPLELIGNFRESRCNNRGIGILLHSVALQYLGEYHLRGNMSPPAGLLLKLA